MSSLLFHVSCELLSTRWCRCMYQLRRCCVVAVVRGVQEGRAGAQGRALIHLSLACCFRNEVRPPVAGRPRARHQRFQLCLFQ